jgi:hypothetical protein
MKTFKYVFLLTALLLTGFTITGQKLTYQREMADAVKEGTRTNTGIPGPEYWQNSSDYKLNIHVVFDGDSTWIEGHAKIAYHNNSPHNLTRIVIRSYPDIFAKGAVRSYYFGGATEMEPVNYTSVLINNDTIPQSALSRRTSTNIMLPLKDPLEKGQVAELDITWRYMMHPQINIRQGVYKDKAIFIAYYYPQVAVFDDLYGWDMVDYTGTVEFYNDFNNYDVEITLPSDYYVWGGGVLQNPSEVYPSEILNRYKAAMKSDEVMSILGTDDLNKGDTTGSKTWHFKSENTPDFTFAASHTYLWDASSIEVEPGRRVLVSAVYPHESRFYSSGAKWARESIDYLSSTCPGVPYPWPSMTVFNDMQGSGGMESPMMVNNGEQRTEISTRDVIFHEIAHSYVPFLTGANERRWSWLDEGWATYASMKFTDAAEGSSRDSFDAIYRMVSGTSRDIPLMVPSFDITESNAYTFYSYPKAAQAYMAIENQLGTQNMYKMWNTFISTWREKHPTPWDFFATVNRVAGSDLNWLLYPWYYKFEHADLELTSFDDRKGDLIVTNKGGLPLPVYITATYNDGSTKQLFSKPEVWKESDVLKIKMENPKDVKSIVIGNRMIFESDETNNSWKK